MIELGKLRFNTTGPCFPNEHYMLDALGRLPDIEPLIASRLYFVLHAARQAGKTTAVKALAKKLNAAGQIAAVYCTLEKTQGYRDVSSCLGLIAQQIMDCAARNTAFASEEEWLNAREAIKLAQMHRAIDQKDSVIRYSCPLVEDALAIATGCRVEK